MFLGWRWTFAMSVGGFNALRFHSYIKHTFIAQLVERLLPNQNVEGSSPSKRAFTH